MFVNDSTEFQPYYEGPNKKATNKILQTNWSAVRTFAMYRQYSTIYNMKVINNNISDATKTMDTIYKEQTTKFKIQASIGFVLYNNVSKALRYWHASCGQDKLFNTPILIENASDYEEFLENLRNKDFIGNATKARPNTAYSMHMVSNLTLYVYPLPQHPIGCPVALPSSVKKR